MQTTTEAPANNKRRALGKGLESLLPRTPQPVAEPVVHAPVPAPVETGKPREIPVGDIDRSPYQTRSRFDEVQLAELAASIEATGVVQPIVVRPLPGGRFQLIAGERRWLASQRAGKETIPAIVRHASDEQAMEMTIVENLQREGLNPMEEARAFERLAREFSLTQEQMSQRTGRERASIANLLRLLRLPETVQQSIEKGELTAGHAKALLALDNPEAIATAAQKVRQLALSVRQTEEMVHRLLAPGDSEQTEAKPKRAIDPNVRAAEEELQRALGVRVTIRDKKGRGKIVIEYASLEDFDRVVETLSK